MRFAPPPLMPMLHHRANQAESALAVTTDVPRWLAEHKDLLAELEHHLPARFQDMRHAIAERAGETMGHG